MKIYTKRGDKGETSLLTGTKVPKFHIRIDAYGTVDELNSFVGLLRDKLQNEELKSTLLIVQNNLFVIGSQLATDKEVVKNIPEIDEHDVVFLENTIDNMEKTLDPLTSFILPGGHELVSLCHVARSVCRRAERLAYKISTKEKVNLLIIKYLNRLSDFLFVFSRVIAKDLKIVEIKWEHKLNK